MKTCRCGHTSNYIYPAGIYNQSKVIVPNEVFSHNASLLFAVPGFQVGCAPQNALLQSTLECFYNQLCLDMVITLTGTLPNASALNISSSSSRFESTTTISVIFDNLMLESWHNSIDFAAYFRACATKTCSYCYEQRFYLIYMITVVASLFGGLSKVLHITSPLLVKCILCLCRQRVRTFEADEGLESSTIPGNIAMSDYWACSCDSEGLCWLPLGFYCSSTSCVPTDSEPDEIVPGIALGCQFLDFDLCSLGCLFNPSCVQMLIDERLYGYENFYVSVDF
ncbi:unnamed protein product, partial [Rotaria sp. Silwood1]